MDNDFHDESSSLHTDTMRAKVLAEILSTEESYVSNLDTLHEVFYIPLITAANDSSKQILPRRRIEQIFSNINVISSLNRKLLYALRDRIEKDPKNAQIGDILMDFSHFFKIYTQYVKNHEESSKIIHRSITSSDKVKKFFDNCSTHPKSEGRNISSYLIMPIQRIPRYQLLLGVLLKHVTNPLEKIRLTKALDSVLQAAQKINDAVKGRENMEATLRIQRLLGDSTELLSPSRHFIMEQELMKQCRRQDKLFMFFLFSDILVYASMRLKGYKLHRIIPIDASFDVIDAQDRPSRNQFRFQIVSSEKTFIVYSSSKEDKLKWIKSLKECIEKSKESITPKSSQNTVQAPLWVSDKESPVCLLCSTLFTMVKRRHHCRCCGKLVCSQCSKHRLNIGDTKKKQRVCDDCAPRFGIQIKPRNRPQLTQSEVNASKVTVTVVKPFEPSETDPDDAIALEVGTCFRILDKSSALWWEAMDGAERVKVRSSCVQVDEGSEEELETVQVRTLCARKGSEVSELAFLKGDVLIVLQANGRFWFAENKRTGETGYVDCELVDREDFEDMSQVSTITRSHDVSDPLWERMRMSFSSSFKSSVKSSACQVCSKCPDFKLSNDGGASCVHCGHSKRRHFD